VKRLPPLTALRAFEAVGRLGSIKGAAKELNVTSAAVTHQIRLLEESLGVALFARAARGLALTASGHEFFHTVSASFNSLHDAARKMRLANEKCALTVNSVPSFATCWLLPRLPAFYREHPGIQLEINIVGNPGQPIDFAQLEADVAIRVTAQDDIWAGQDAEKLTHEVMFPVCAPALVHGGRPPRTPEDLAHHTLLIVTRRPEGWPEWLQGAAENGANITGIDPAAGLKFDTIQMATSAAIEGLGVAMGRRPLIDSYLAEDRLVAPFDLKIPSKAAYWLICRPGTRATPVVEKFRQWLRRELAAGDRTTSYAADSEASVLPTTYAFK
jgi:LysR family glycine cleavage system transcriptional activator